MRLRAPQRRANDGAGLDGRSRTIALLQERLQGRCFSHFAQGHRA
jgi:hypothetical protein